jgi:hypothetical protein
MATDLARHIAQIAEEITVACIHARKPTSFSSGMKRAASAALAHWGAVNHLHSHIFSGILLLWATSKLLPLAPCRSCHIVRLLPKLPHCVKRCAEKLDVVGLTWSRRTLPAVTAPG